MVLLRKLGLSYVLDWTADDQPFHLNKPGMLSVPYSVELNDIGMFVARSFTGPAFYQAAVDHFDQLYADAAGSVRVMALAPTHSSSASRRGPGTWTRPWPTLLAMPACG